MWSSAGIVVEAAAWDTVVVTVLMAVSMAVLVAVSVSVTVEAGIVMVGARIVVD